MLRLRLSMSDFFPLILSVAKNPLNEVSPPTTAFGGASPPQGVGLAPSVGGARTLPTP